MSVVLQLECGPGITKMLLFITPPLMSRQVKTKAGNALSG